MLIQQLFKITDNRRGDFKASNPCIRRFLFSPNKKTSTKCKRLRYNGINGKGANKCQN